MVRTSRIAPSASPRSQRRSVASSAAAPNWTNTSSSGSASRRSSRSAAPCRSPRSDSSLASMSAERWSPAAAATDARSSASSGRCSSIRIRTAAAASATRSIWPARAAATASSLISACPVSSARAASAGSSCSARRLTSAGPNARRTDRLMAPAAARTTQRSSDRTRTSTPRRSSSSNAVVGEDLAGRPGIDLPGDAHQVEGLALVGVERAGQRGPPVAQARRVRQAAGQADHPGTRRQGSVGHGGDQRIDQERRQTPAVGHERVDGRSIRRGAGRPLDQLGHVVRLERGHIDAGQQTAAPEPGERFDERPTGRAQHDADRRPPAGARGRPRPSRRSAGGHRRSRGRRGPPPRASGSRSADCEPVHDPLSPGALGLDQRDQQRRHPAAGRPGDHRTGTRTRGGRSGRRAACPVRRGSRPRALPRRHRTHPPSTPTARRAGQGIGLTRRWWPAPSSGSRSATRCSPLRSRFP